MDFESSVFIGEKRRRNSLKLNIRVIADGAICDGSQNYEGTTGVLIFLSMLQT